MALPKPYRLRERKEFERVYRRGQRCGSPALLLRIASQPKTITKQSPGTPAPIKKAKSTASKPVAPQAPKPSRIAVVVSTKVHKRAVVRNRLRRQIQAALQSLLAQLLPGRLIVITVKPPAVECDYYKFLQQLEQLLIKAEALHGH